MNVVLNRVEELPIYSTPSIYLYKVNELDEEFSKHELNWAAHTDLRYYINWLKENCGDIIDFSSIEY